MEWFVDQHRKTHDRAVGTEWAAILPGGAIYPSAASKSVVYFFQRVPWRACLRFLGRCPPCFLLGKEPESEQRMLPYHPGGWPKQLQKGLISFTAEKQSFCRCKVASLNPRVLICYSQSPQVVGKLHAIGRLRKQKGGSARQAQGGVGWMWVKPACLH